MRASWTRLLVVGILLLAVLLTAAVLPVPSPLQIRAWAQSVGVAAPLLFLVGHTLATVAPVPRTMFTLAAGLLFGPVLGVALSLVATTGTTSPALPAVSLTGAAMGVAGLAVEARAARIGSTP